MLILPPPYTLDYRLSPHFSLRELTWTLHRGYLERNIEEAIPFIETALIPLCQVMETVRWMCGGHPISVHSGFRCPDLNTAIHGSPTSQHKLGEAMDFHVIGLSVEEVWMMISSSDLPFGQCLCEGPAMGSWTWVHLSLGAPWRAARKCGQSFQVVA